MSHPHDQNFKNLLTDYPREALDLAAAAEVVGIGLQAVRITPVRQEQLQERLGERFRELDVPLLVEWPDGRREALLFVLEERERPATLLHPPPGPLLSGPGRVVEDHPRGAGGHLPAAGGQGAATAAPE